MKRHLSLVLLLLLALGCTPAAKQRQAVQDDSGSKLTVGTVQREIRVGMTSAEVIEVLGSPNVVTTDSERREVWAYDKISTEHVYSTSNGGVNILILGAGGSTGASSTTQRTLTIIIKFDEQSRVRDFAYRQSSF